MYVEPFQVVDMTNDLKDLQVSLKAEENKILLDMCRFIAQFKSEIKAAALAVSEVDMIQARYKIGQLMDAVVPEVCGSLLQCNERCN